MTGDISSRYHSPAQQVQGHSPTGDRVSPSIPGWYMLAASLLSPSGGWAVTGPTQVTAKQGGSLAVSCSYESGYELYPKYWCRPGFLWICSTYITQTNGSEVTVRQGRVSIEDKHTERSFTVILGNVSPGDAGWYSCGVRRRLWFNLQHSTEVMVSTGKARMGAKQGGVVELVIRVTALGQDVPSQGPQGL